MNIILQLIVIVFGSASIGSVIAYFSTKNKLKAETNNLIGKTYGDLIDDLRKMVEFQGAQIKSMQDREVELLKIINAHNDTERDLRSQIKALENKLLEFINDSK